MPVIIKPTRSRSVPQIEMHIQQKMVQFQLVFNNLFLEDMKDEGGELEASSISSQKMKNVNMGGFDDNKTPVMIAITFDKGSIPHPHPTLRSNATFTVQMKGAILLSLPLGEYPKLVSYDDSKFDDILKNMALEYSPLEHETSLGHISLYPARCLLLMVPTLKQRSKELFLKIVFVFWSMESFFSRALYTSMPLLLKEHFTDFERFLVNIFTGLYRNTEAIPNTDIPELNSILKAWFMIYETLKGQVRAGYDQNHQFFLNELLNWVRSYKISALYMGSEWEPTNQPYTLFTKLGGRKLILELLQLLSSTHVAEYIREHALFKMFVESTDLICNLVYDLVGLTEGRNLYRNVLLSEITNGGLSFEAALERHLLVINNEILDLQKVSKALVKEFPEVEGVDKYVRNATYLVDGTIRIFCDDGKVMKVVSISYSRI